MYNDDIMAIRYPNRFNRTAANEDLYFVKQSPSNKRLISLDFVGVSHPDSFYEIRAIHSSTFNIEYVISGKGYIAVNKKLHEVKAGDTFLLHIGPSRHYYADPKEPWEKIFISIAGKLAESASKMYCLEDITLIPGFDSKSELSEIVELAKASEKSGNDYTDKIIEVLHRLLFKIYGFVHANTPYSAEEMMMDYLDKHIHSDFNMDTFALAMNKSKSQITRLFKKAYGETPYKYLLNKRINMAKIALTGGNEPLKSISADLCFYDEYYFSSYFKEVTGYSPSEYRKIFAKKYRNTENK